MNIIQIGCHDGNDHVFQFVSENYETIDRLILVEPLKEKLKEAKIKYQNFKFVEFFELAIVDSEDQDEISFFFPEDLIHSQISSIDINHVLRHRQDVKEVKVKCLNIKKFLDSLNLSKIDKFYIDTEGLDCKLIKQIDFNKYSIDYIEYEYIHSDGSYTFGQNGSEVQNMLLNLGYNKIEHPPFNVAFYK